jgi:hypothetical protein
VTTQADYFGTAKGAAEPGDRNQVWRGVTTPRDAPQGHRLTPLAPRLVVG